MSLWLTYGLLGAIAGPVVTVVGSCVALREPLSWSLAVRGDPVAMLAASALLSVVLVEVAERRPAAAGAVSWLVILGLLLTLIDWACHRLPQVLVGTLLGGGLIQLGLSALVQPDGAGRVLRAVCALAVVFAVAVTMALVSPQGWGAGDVTLAATVAFFLGWFSWWHVVIGLGLALMLGAVTFGVLRLIGVYRRGLLIPFGPALIFAPVCTILLR
ncbi:prepilin peptidase [Lentzea aerocolonigenes]|uniref:prepilin peptidase n=1 Tax=Lentzea aerocolonigenes TaxID=68170 RepID=UPI000A89331D|nr:prepilin peptidase [Lentzea aerocolonigenes]MCP2243325.1 leader peptidase (prepilin peptidase) / N-methyltransferase [Lentzea aerocolonigenes]